GQVRTLFAERTQFGRARRAYGTHWLSGVLVCAECGGTLSIRTGHPQRYGCTRHWRRGATAYPNNLMVRRDLAEARVGELLQTRRGPARGRRQRTAAGPTARPDGRAGSGSRRAPPCARAVRGRAAVRRARRWLGEGP